MGELGDRDSPGMPEDLQYKPIERQAEELPVAEVTRVREVREDSRVAYDRHGMDEIVDRVSRGKHVGFGTKMVVYKGELDDGRKVAIRTPRPYLSSPRDAVDAWADFPGRVEAYARAKDLAGFQQLVNHRMDNARRVVTAEWVEGTPVVDMGKEDLTQVSADEITEMARNAMQGAQKGVSVDWMAANIVHTPEGKLVFVDYEPMEQSDLPRDPAIGFKNFLLEASGVKASELMSPDEKRSSLEFLRRGMKAFQEVFPHKAKCYAGLWRAYTKAF